MKYLKHSITLIAMIMSTHLHAQSAKKALLVIDLQENLLNPESRLHVDSPSIEPLCSRVNLMIKQYNQKGWPVLYVVNEWTNPILNWVTGNVVKKGAKGTGIDPRIERVNQTIYIKSAGDALSNKDLLCFLKEQGIQELTLTGVFSNQCVKETLKSGLKKGYQVTVIEDAIGARSAKAQEHSLQYFRQKGAKVYKSTSI
jgi:nicotinamidase-related amidase